MRDETSRRRRRFWVEAVLAFLSLTLTVVTLISREWIELIFGVDPDGGDGNLEWAIVAGFVVLTIASSALARREWLRSAVA